MRAAVTSAVAGIKPRRPSAVTVCGFIVFHPIWRSDRCQAWSTLWGAY